MKIHLSESSEWTGVLFDLRVDSGVASFAGHEIYRDEFPPVMNLRQDTVRQLEGALAMLAVFDWRKEYRPEDVGATVDDGGSWSLDVTMGERSISSAGWNAAPGYESPGTTSLHEERYGLLRAAVFMALKLSIPFGFFQEKSFDYGSGRV